MSFDFTHLFIIAPEIYLFFGTLVLLLISLLFQKSPAAEVNDRRQVVAELMIGFLTLCGTVLMLVYAPQGRGEGVLSGFVMTTPLTQFLKIIILFAGAAVMIYIHLASRKGASDPISYRFELPVLVMLSILGMMVMVSSSHLLSFYMGLELQSLALYVLAAFQREEKTSTEAGVKYIILGALSSGMILYGASLLYGFAGPEALGFEELSGFIGVGAESLNPGLIFGLMFILAGLSFKIAAVPFHMWAPDVYQGSPLSVTAFFAMAPKVAAIGVLINFLSESFVIISGPEDMALRDASLWQGVLMILSVASMIVGALGAMGQSNLKRLLAYSSIGHMGYVLSGLLLGTVSGLASVVFYLLVYVIMTAGVFACLHLLARNKETTLDFNGIRGLSSKSPGIAFMIMIFMFSMAGIPPLAGFFAKLEIFSAIVKAGFIWLAVIGVITSVLAAYYYIKIVKIMYFEDSIAKGKSEPLHTGSSMIAIAASFGMIIYIFIPSGILNFIYGLVQS